MKVQVTIEVPDPARHYIAKLAPTGETIADGRANREAIRQYLQTFVETLSEDFTIAPTRKLTDIERAEANEAIEYLRAQGKSEGQIRAWLLMQNARFKFGKKGLLE